jgi:hypothetical protein
MKKTLLILPLIVLMMALSSCSITLPVNATSNQVGTKVGTSKAKTWFGIFHFKQDASIKSAAKNGGITKIATVDLKTQIFPFGILIKHSCIVTGD